MYITREQIEKGYAEIKPVLESIGFIATDRGGIFKHQVDEYQHNFDFTAVRSDLVAKHAVSLIYLLGQSNGQKMKAQQIREVLGIS